MQVTIDILLPGHLVVSVNGLNLLDAIINSQAELVTMLLSLAEKYRVVQEAV